MRVIKSSEEYFDILDQIKGGAIITIGYVTAANLDVPKIKKKNPATNRIKGYDDYSMFQNEGENEIGALVKITSYNFNYRNRSSVHNQYHHEYKPAVNNIRQEFGLEPMKSRAGFKNVIDFGEHGQEVYGGKNEKLFGNSYNPQNMFKPLHISSTTYAVDNEGHIIKELSKDQVLPYLKKKDADGIPALRKMGADEEKIKQFIEKINELKFNYKNFESHSILYIVGTINGEKMIYLNDKLQRSVNDIDINPDDFLDIARDRYEKDLAQIQEDIINQQNILKESNEYKNIVTLMEKLENM